MSEPGLKHDEKSLFSVNAKVLMDGQKDGPTGKLHITDKGRLSFVVTSGGLFRKDYDNYPIDFTSIETVRVESGIFGLGKRLVIEWEDSEQHTFRFEGSGLDSFKFNADELCTRILKDMKKPKDDVEKLDMLFRILRSSEKISFDDFFNHIIDSHLLTFDEIEDDEGFTKDMILKIKNKEKFTDEEQRKVDEKIIEMISVCVGPEGASGIIDKENRVFINMEKYKRQSEVVQYNIATSFEFGKNGAVLIKCPNCNAQKPQTEKQSQVVCPACGQTYAVPKKILDMV